MGSILLVEHDSTWHATFDDAGHETVIAEGLEETLLLLRDGGIDVVVVDAQDPRSGIVELARAIATLPDAPPLVLISSSPEAPELSARIGAATFLAKPCDPRDVLAAIDRLIGPSLRGFDEEPTFARDWSPPDPGRTTPFPC